MFERFVIMCWHSVKKLNCYSPAMRCFEHVCEKKSNGERERQEAEHSQTFELTGASEKNIYNCKNTFLVHFFFLQVFKTEYRGKCERRYWKQITHTANMQTVGTVRTHRTTWHFCYSAVGVNFISSFSLSCTLIPNLSYFLHVEAKDKKCRKVTSVQQMTSKTLPKFPHHSSLITRFSNKCSTIGDMHRVIYIYKSCVGRVGMTTYYHV